MKNGILILAIISMSTLVMSQQPCFPLKKGSVLEYVAKDANGIITGYSRLTVKEITKTGNNQIFTMEAQSFDAKKIPEANVVAFKVKLMKDKIVFDPKAMLPKDLGMNMEITGTGYTIPLRMAVGQKWSNAEATLTMDMGFTKMEASLTLTERKVLAKEKITVSAGTFECYKAQQLALVTIPIGSPLKQKHIMWYAEGVGLVKTEIYKENNQLQTVEELISIK